MNQLLRQAGGVVKIEDVLPLFPDFVQIDAFKDAICQSLEDYNAQVWPGHLSVWCLGWVHSRALVHLPRVCLQQEGHAGTCTFQGQVALGRHCKSGQIADLHAGLWDPSLLRQDGHGACADLSGWLNGLLWHVADRPPQE